MEVLRELYLSPFSGPPMVAMTALWVIVFLGAIFTVEDIENDKREAKRNEER